MPSRRRGPRRSICRCLLARRARPHLLSRIRLRQQFVSEAKALTQAGLDLASLKDELLSPDDLEEYSEIWVSTQRELCLRLGQLLYRADREGLLWAVEEVIIDKAMWAIGR